MVNSVFGLFFGLFVLKRSNSVYYVGCFSEYLTFVSACSSPVVFSCWCSGVLFNSLFSCLFRKVAVVGAGYIAVELAGILNALGSQVSSFIRRDKVLGVCSDHHYIILYNDQ